MTYVLVVGPWEGFTQLPGFPPDLFDEYPHPPNANTVIQYRLGRVYFWFPERITPTTPRWAATVAHEATHAAVGMLTDRGLQVNTDEADEALAYYVGWLVEKILVALKARHK